MLDRLQDYRAKRDFRRTSEPAGLRSKSKVSRGYLIQKHAARRLHFDFRLEHKGTLLSWAIPRGPSLDPSDKRLAVRVEDHPLEYGKFEGTIPKGEYGGGTVMLWDRGTWEPLGDPDEGLSKGVLKFRLRGKRLKGGWVLVRLRVSKKRGAKENWLLIKERDAELRTGETPLIEQEITSVKTGRDMAAIARGKIEWRSNKRAAVKITSAARAPSKKGSSSLPPFIAPQLATLVDAPPQGKDWIHEIKFDGYRTITSVAGGSVVIRTRNGFDWTDRFQQLVAPLSNLPCESALLDGEVAVADAEGHTDFGALQDALSPDALSKGKGAIGYYLFDLLHLNGENLRARPLIERKKPLKKLLDGAARNGPLFYSDHISGDGDLAFARACDLKLEGIISKQASAPYRSGRTKSWLKSKCGMAQEFVIVGWRPSTKPGRPFSSILLAVREEGELRYCGRVGSGYSDTGLDNLAAEFKKHARKESPVEGIPPTIARQARYLKPALVAEIAFRGWTRGGLIRQGSFKGLRADKPASAIIRERPMPKAKAVRIADTKTDETEGVRITHPDRVLYADQGTTKRELIAHYLSVADRMLPHIAGRPLALVRCPRGSEKECFFQKHASAGWPDEFRKIRIKEKSGAGEYLYIEDVPGLVAAAQMGVLELHIWGSHVDSVEQPDRLVFDIDPDEGLPFAQVRDAAQELRQRLEELKLQSFPMATGGKGIHVVMPLARRHSWQQHRDFAEAIARLMAEDTPERYVANMSKAKRRGKIYLDYLRNQRGATAIAPYSSRARKGAFYTMPLSWRDLSGLKNAHPSRIGEKLGRGDPWAGYHKLRQTLPGLKGG